jgi:hypothetical protein
MKDMNGSSSDESGALSKVSDQKASKKRARLKRRRVWLLKSFFWTIWLLVRIVKLIRDLRDWISGS